MKKLLLIVGTANDVFIYNMAKWLKHSMSDLIIDVFEFYKTTAQECSNEFYDNLYTAHQPRIMEKSRVVKHLYQHFNNSHELSSFLNCRYYDIIHCHWIIQPIVLTNSIKNHCSSLFVTFWGGEQRLKILNSSRLYKYLLLRFLNSVDYLVNSRHFRAVFNELYPEVSVEYRIGYLGSASLEYLYEIMKHYSRSQIKERLSIPVNKLSVLIGYSGKLIHRHLDIIKALLNAGIDENGIHIIAPMTRGGSIQYVESVEHMLQNSPFSYTLYKDRFLSNEEIAMLRYSTDVVLQLSDFDGFSRSIVECFCAKSIVIYGDWLDYESNLQESGFKGIKVSSISEAIEALEYILVNMQIYESITEQNSLNGKMNNIWSECIKDWVNAYKEVL